MMVQRYYVEANGTCVFEEAVQESSDDDLDMPSVQHSAPRRRRSRRPSRQDIATSPSPNRRRSARLAQKNAKGKRM